jgi:glucose/arabinose dehydrogenase
MKRTAIIVSALTLTALSLLVIPKLFNQQIGDLRPAVLPAKPVNLSDPVPLTVPSGFEIGRFAAGVTGARDLQFSPGGTLLVSQPGSGQVSALPDANNDGSSDRVKAVLTGLDKPHGLAFHQNWLFVAEENRVSRYLWDEASLSAKLDKILFDLPSGGRHTTRSLAVNPLGQLFVSIGSTCDVCVEKHPWIGSVIVSNSDGTPPRIFASGLRNAVFIALGPDSLLWGTEMGRDFLGDNLPPDEVNILRDGANYGWPYCYGNRVPDTSFGGNPNRCSQTTAPAFEVPAHSAPLGLTFIDSGQFPSDWQGDLVVAYHGSWNRSTPSGYKVVRLKVDGQSVVAEEDFVTGFTSGNQAVARPVDLAFDSQGSLYLSDDKAGTIYKIIRP